jgi:GTP-binding protein EngB required for normal cell division
LTKNEEAKLNSESISVSPCVAGGASTTTSADGASKLLRLAKLGEELGSTRVAEEARDLAARVSEGRFYVACVGQFKRGKSTLINALVGEAILPVGFTPVTAVPTVVRFGERLSARIKARDFTWTEIPVSEVKQYVSEEHNPENTKGITGVEVYVPNQLLSRGMCLVDTPGLGSVFTGNTSATQDFIPHIDAALVVVGADPPLAGEEFALVEAVARNVQDVIVVLNKADRTTDEERAAAASFTRNLLEKRLSRPIGPVLEVSALERFEKRGPERDWPKLLEALDHLVQDSGRQIILAACSRGIVRLSEELVAIVAEEREALERPIEESERRIEALRVTIAEAERSMRELGFLLMAEQQRLSDMFVARRKAFLGSMTAQSLQEFWAAVPSVPRTIGPTYRRALANLTQDIARRRVMPWLSAEKQEAEREYAAVSRRFVQMGNEFLQKLADGGVAELGRMPHALDPETGFRAGSRFSFLDLIEIAQPASPLRWLADMALAFVGARKVIQKQAAEFLEHLLDSNSARVQSDILNRVQESRGRLEVEIRKLLHEVSRIAEQALAHARSAQSAGASAVQSELARLAQLDQEIHETWRARRLHNGVNELN